VNESRHGLEGMEEESLAKATLCILRELAPGIQSHFAVSPIYQWKPFVITHHSSENVRQFHDDGTYKNTTKEAYSKTTIDSLTEDSVPGVHPPMLPVNTTDGESHPHEGVPQPRPNEVDHSSQDSLPGSEGCDVVSWLPARKESQDSPSGLSEGCCSYEDTSTKDVVDAAKTASCNKKQTVLVETALENHKVSSGAPAATAPSLLGELEGPKTLSHNEEQILAADQEKCGVSPGMPMLTMPGSRETLQGSSTASHYERQISEVVRREHGMSLGVPMLTIPSLPKAVNEPSTIWHNENENRDPEAVLGKYEVCPGVPIPTSPFIPETLQGSKTASRNEEQIYEALR